MTFREFTNITDATLNGAITDSATSLAVNDGSSYPSNAFAIRINDEVIHVSSRTTNTFNSLTRGFDGTTAAAHSNADAVQLVVIAQDMKGLWTPQMNLEVGKNSTDTPDDDFDTGSLDGKWNVNAGSSGTVSLLGTTGSTYDLTTRNDMLLMQGYNAAAVELRQAYTLPDGNSMICAVGTSFLGDAGIVNNEVITGMGLNDSTTTVWVADAANLGHDTGSSQAQLFFSSSSSTFGTSFNNQAGGHTIYFRIARSSLTYYGFWSYDGISWVSMGQTTKADALDHVWIFMNGLASAPGNPKPVSAFKWIRQGSNGIDPW